MPYYHCSKCHHEFEGYPLYGVAPKCDWCGSDTYILEEKTPLEEFVDELSEQGYFVGKGEENG